VFDFQYKFSGQVNWIISGKCSLGDLKAEITAVLILVIEFVATLGHSYLNSMLSLVLFMCA
jgi:hypothetical protein